MIGGTGFLISGLLFGFTLQSICFLSGDLFMVSCVITTHCEVPGGRVQAEIVK